MKHVNRRKFLRLSAAGAATLAACGDTAKGVKGMLGPGTDNPVADGDAGTDLGPVAVGDAGQSPATASLPVLPRDWPRSYSRMATDDQELELRLLSGKLPGDLYGHLFINGPIPRGEGGHPFNGDGMVRRIDFGSSTVRFTSRLTRTPDLYLDLALEGTDKAFQNAGAARFSNAGGLRNQLNIGFQPFGNGRLLITNDAGRPYEIDPATLDLVGPLGSIANWKAGIPAPFGVMPNQFTSSHPFYDAHSGELFTTNHSVPSGTYPLAGVDFFELLRLKPDGSFDRWQVQVDDPLLGSYNARIAQSAHQFAMTEDYIILMDCAVNIEMLQLLDNNTSDPQLPECALFIIKRSDLKADKLTVSAKRVVIPRESGHIRADFANPDGKITVLLGHLVGMDMSEWIRDGDKLLVGGAPPADLVGFFNLGTDMTPVGRYVIDAEASKLIEGDTALTFDDRYHWSSIFDFHRGWMAPDRHEVLYFGSLGYHESLVTTRAANMYEKHPYRRVALADLPKTGKPANLFRVDAGTMQLADGYEYPTGRIMGSPTFLPKQGKTGPTEGYVVALMISDDTADANSTGDEFWIFDAANLQGGPLCRLGHPELNLGFTIHTVWLDEVKPAPRDQVIPVREDYAKAYADADADMQRVLDEEVFPHFD